MKVERNYARFYILLKQMPYADKESIVLEYTNGRTTHVSETTGAEYILMCRDMERMVNESEQRRRYREELRCWRSVCLKLMQQIGVNTTSWNAVNRYCQSRKIAQKEFRFLDIEDLQELSLKLRMILKKSH